VETVTQDRFPLTAEQIAFKAELDAEAAEFSRKVRGAMARLDALEPVAQRAAPFVQGVVAGATVGALLLAAFVVGAVL
jgi:hypothetical protein